MASPPKGGIGDGFIRSIKQSSSKPKTTTTYYAKPLYPPMKRKAGPKPQVYKVIIHEQPKKKVAPPKKQEIYKIIHLPSQQPQQKVSKSVKIFKIINVKKPTGGHGGTGKWT